MEITRSKLIELLVQPGHIGQEDFERAEQEAKRQKNNLLDSIVDLGLIKDSELGQLLAQDLGLPFINLREEKIDPEVLKLVPEVIARSRKVIAFKQDDTGVSVGMVNPGDQEMINVLTKRFGLVVKPYLITESDFLKAMINYRSNLAEEFKGIMGELKGQEISSGQASQVVRMVDLILEQAVMNRASDIHIEPFGDNFIVRFRIDSVMHRALELPRGIIDSITMRIKILSKMKIDEHRSAQDGKFQFKSQNETIDVRVSIVPVSGGENIVMRLLSAKARQMSLKELGLNEKDLSQVEKIIKHPHGMILSTGPTGCGKTTSLYSVLKILNRTEVNIATIEDPVEYDIPGVSQIQVNSRTNLSFAQGLRAIVRQDPDIIMVGEIRDEETAQIATNSAMTGHLVLSTLHANDAATTLPRLLDMGIEPFLVASTIKVIIAQRLVRTICPKCRASYLIEGEEEKIIKDNPKLSYAISQAGINDIKKIRFYKGSGCKVCAQSGYSGRIGIFEVLILSEAIKDLILKHASSDEIVNQAVSEGMTTILQDGLKKVLNGVTTLSEVIRVTEAGV